MSVITGFGRGTFASRYYNDVCQVPSPTTSKVTDEHPSVNREI